MIGSAWAAFGILKRSPTRLHGTRCGRLYLPYTQSVLGVDKAVLSKALVSDLPRKSTWVIGETDDCSKATKEISL